MVENTLAAQIWNDKYKFTPQIGEGDENIAATWRRVANAIAQNEPEQIRSQWAQTYFDALQDFRFIPAGRILAGAGTSRAVTLFNCFVMGVIPDNLNGIFEHLREAAITMQQGGGVGMDFSTIRPNGAPVVGIGAKASGPISFMHSWDAMCGTIMAAGQRRGAMMACLRISHPDIEAFIEAKANATSLRNFNLSVLVSDDFMAARANDEQWPLKFGGDVYRRVSARGLWDKLMQANYDNAEPGVIFIDRVNQNNNLSYSEKIIASNPCGEQMLPPYGACLLGSINLAQLVERPFTAESVLDEVELAAITRTAVRFLDNVIDISRYPLKEQELEAKAKRRIGLGITGLADALLFCNSVYGSQSAIELTKKWLGIIKREAYITSAELAAEKGAFPLYDKAILDSPNLQSLDKQTRKLIAQNGLRNGCLTSIAPTGTTSLLAGNVSSGIEPVFAYAYNRKVRGQDGSLCDEKVEDYGFQVWKKLKGDEPPPEELFVSAQTLPPKAHVAMQAAAQTQIDSSISKTVNCPEDIDFAAFSNIYIDGYEQGCKGMTTYRPNAVTGSILSIAAAAPKTSPSEPILAPRPENLHGTTYKVKWPDSAHAVYVTINDIETDGKVRPFEIFINSKNMEHYAWTLGLTRMVSAVLRRGGDVSFVAEELKAVFDPRGGAWIGGHYVPSLLAAIGGIFERHLGALAPIASAPKPVEPTAHRSALLGAKICPQCGAAALHCNEGCVNCHDCGYSKCG
ncbi:MAG: ribonucleoside-diphosphate reductase alpha chain [Hyphomonadaceae bacterium]|nr:MAG: ribonucleoside-diphosphate reductase alpha chain [Hyphomonadaceae bacterium]